MRLLPSLLFRYGRARTWTKPRRPLTSSIMARAQSCARVHTPRLPSPPISAHSSMSNVPGHKPLHTSIHWRHGGDSNRDDTSQELHTEDSSRDIDVLIPDLSTEERDGGISPQESNQQAYTQEVCGCEGCLPNLSNAEDDVDSVLRNIEEISEAVFLPEKRRPNRLASRRSSAMDIDQLVEFLHEERAVDVCVLVLPRELEYVNYFVTCSGMGHRHIQRMADNLAAELKTVEFGGRAFVEGRESEGWIAVDMGTIVLHLMTEDIRKTYELEKLWTLGRNYDDQCREMETFLSQNNQLL